MLRLTILLALTALAAIAVPIDCASGTLNDYLTLSPEGCRLGSRVLTDFFPGQLTQGSTPIDPSSILITPSVMSFSASLLFSFNSTVTDATILESIFQTTVTPDGGSSDRVDLQLIGATATGDGLVAGILDTCSDFILGGLCTGSGQTVIASKSGLDDFTFATATISPGFQNGTRQYDLMQDIVIDAGLLGTASLTSAQLTFTAVPEPSTLMTFACGMLLLLIRPRR